VAELLPLKHRRDRGWTIPFRNTARQRVNDSFISHRLLDERVPCSIANARQGIGYPAVAYIDLG